MHTSSTTAFVALFFFASLFAACSAAGCQQNGAVPAAQFQELMQSLQAQSNQLVRKDLLETTVANYTSGFTGEQMVSLLGLFDNQLVAKEVLIALNPLILGITCQQNLAILNLYSNELIRLDILVYTVNLTIDLEINNQTLLTVFANTFNKRDAQKIIDDAAPRSCVWGDVSVKRLIFVVDTSGSMSATFVDNFSGKTYTRLQFVAQQLDTVIRKSLQDTQEFNVISFSDYPHAWSPGVVPVTDPNVDSAVTFVGKLSPGGGTAMLSALKLAFQDPNALAIYLLTDGQPNESTSTILAAATQWSKSSDPPKPINAIAFMAGGSPDPAAAAFMQRVAQATGGVYRSVE